MHTYTLTEILQKKSIGDIKGAKQDRNIYDILQNN